MHQFGRGPDQVKHLHCSNIYFRGAIGVLLPASRCSNDPKSVTATINGCEGKQSDGVARKWRCTGNDNSDRENQSFGCNYVSRSALNMVSRQVGDIEKSTVRGHKGCICRNCMQLPNERTAT